MRGWKDDPDTLPLLKDRARSGRPTLGPAIQALARGWKDHPCRSLLQWWKVPARDRKRCGLAAVQELARGWKDDPEVIRIATVELVN